MNTFIIIAAAMALVAAAVVAVPLLRNHQSRLVALLAAIVVAGSAAGLYPLWSNFNWHAPSTAAAPKTATAPAITKALGERLGKTPGLAKEVGAIVQLLVTSPDAAYLVDLKNGAGSVTEGKGAADVTLKIADEDLETLAKDGNLRDLYQRGKIRIDGDARVAHKLTFFKGLV